MIFPNFDNSILNVSATLANYLGNTKEIPKIKILEDELEKNYKNVIQIIIDGLGQRIIEKNPKQSKFLATNTKSVITSVFPSTTTNATTTLISASYPAQHGWFAWAMNFKELNKTVALFRNTDHYTGESLEQQNFVQNRLPREYFFANTRKDITAYTCMPSQIKMKEDTTNNVSFANTKDMFKNLDILCKKENAKFIYCYHCALDSKMHDYGTTSKQAKKVLKQLDKGLRKLINKNPDTLIILTADHGHIDVNGFVEIYKDKEVMDCLSQPISLDPRGAAFHVKSNMKENFTQAFEKYKKDFDLFPTQQLIDKGVFGPFDKNKHKEFLGDFIAAGKETNKMLLFAEGKSLHKGTLYKGHHTGLTEDEMLVPLIIIGKK